MDIADALLRTPASAHTRQVWPSDREYVIGVVRRRVRADGWLLRVRNLARPSRRGMDRTLNRPQTTRFALTPAPVEGKGIDLVDTGEL